MPFHYYSFVLFWCGNRCNACCDFALVGSDRTSVVQAAGYKDGGTYNQVVLLQTLRTVIGTREFAPNVHLRCLTFRFIDYEL
jgi:hypothetical protein